MIKYDYSGRVALVTGGTSGIGLAVARAFAMAGANLVLAGRGSDAGSACVAELERQGTKVLFVRTDVRDEQSVAQMVDAAMARFGRLDAACNAAGIGGDMASLEATEQSVWDDVLNTNTRGVWLSMRYEIPAMLASGGGAIVNIASIYGLAGRPAHHAYVASKHAVVGLTRSVALEFAARGIRANALCAGVTATPAMRAAESIVPDLVRALVAEHPVGRMASEEEIAAAVLWLCSDASQYVTGAPLSVDGGFAAA
jgi:NAD(P)-dependent dehydrogenase (short-subunit alcohol dehydrogenase family)